MYKYTDLSSQNINKRGKKFILFNCTGPETYKIINLFIKGVGTQVTYKTSNNFVGAYAFGCVC